MLTLAVATSGCSWLNLRSGGSRTDPLVMSHLTHGKENAAYAASEASVPNDSPIQSASVSQKLGTAQRDNVYEHASHREATPAERLSSAPADYRWFQGRVSRHAHEAGWRLRYAPSIAADRYGGEIALQGNDRLALLREGDRVFVEGRLIDDANRASFHVESLTVLPQ
jgi:hypothetical protein